MTRLFRAYVGLLVLSVMTSMTFSAQAAPRVYTAKDYERIQDVVHLSRQAKKMIKANLCAKPAIAAWVDELAGRAAKEGVDVPEFSVVTLQYYANLDVMLIRDKAEDNYMVELVGAGECGAASVQGPIKDSDIVGVSR